MKILVCISNVPDTTTKIRFDAEMKNLSTDGVQWVINPWDELALTRALELKEKSGGKIEKVSIVNVGLPTAEPTIRKALAIGADDAYRIDSEPRDSYFVAAQIAELAKRENFDLILTGIESSDFNSSSVGAMVAEFLDIQSISAVSTIDFNGDQIEIKRDIDGGKETIATEMPVVATVQKGICINPRIAAMRGIMMAKQKKIEVITPNQIDTLVESVVFEIPPAKAECKMLDADNTDALVELLHGEAKVL